MRTTQDPDQAANPDRPPLPDVRLAAQDFVRTHGLPEVTPEDDAVADSTGPVPALSALLTDPRPADTGWWCRIAAGWLQTGLPTLARSSASRALELAKDGKPAAWADLGTLADLLARTARPGGSAAASGLGLQGESRTVKRERIGLLFGHGPYATMSQRVAALTAAEDLDGLILCVAEIRDVDWTTLTRVWHRTHYDRLVIEQFFARVAGQPLTSWLPEGPMAEALVWCGWSFRRTGDPATAHACFRLALALEEIEVPSPPGTGPPQSRPSEPLTGAREYLARFPDPPDDADVPGDLQPRSAQSARLAEWLEERSLQGYFPTLTGDQHGLARWARPSSRQLPLRALAARSGWYLPAVTSRHPRGVSEPDRAELPPVSLPAAPAVPMPAHRRADWPPPPPILARPPEDPGTAACIGLTEAGGVATLRVQPGKPVLLARVPSGNAVLDALAGRLTADGWTVLWARRPEAETAGSGTGGSRGQHRLGPTASPTDLSVYLLRELAGTPLLRWACSQCLYTLLPARPDPAARLCVDAAIAALRDDEPREILLGGGHTSVRRLAAALVDRAIPLAFTGREDIRRAAALLDLTVHALLKLRQALCVAWEEPGLAAPEPPACAELGLPTDQLNAALSTVLVAGSMARAVAAQRGPATDSPAAAVDFLIEVRRREKRRMSEEDVAAAIQAADEQRTREREQPPSPPPSPADSTPIGSPWTEHGLVSQEGGHRLCLMLTGSFGRCWDPMLDWLRRGGLPVTHTVVSCIPSADELDIRTARCYDTVLTGALPPEQRLLLEISAGIRLAPDQVGDLGKYGAIQVRTGTGHGAGRLERLIVLPELEGGR